MNNIARGLISCFLTVGLALAVPLALTVPDDVYAAPGGGGGKPPKGGGGGGGGETSPKNAFNIMMNYELGMHCTGFEFAYCCVLPPYNSILAQVVKTTKDSTFPKLLEADPNVGLDVLNRPTVLRDGFNKYVLRYWHDAQPRDNGLGAPQTSTLISLVEGNSLLMWNTMFDAATLVDGKLQYSDGTPCAPVPGMPLTTDCDGSIGVLKGDGSLLTTGLFGFSVDNYWNGVWNHLYIYADPAHPTPVGPNLEGHGATGLEGEKIRLGIHVDYAENEGAALQPMGPGVPGHGFGNVLTFSGDTGTVVYTQMKVLDDLPIMLTSPRIWEALGLPLTPFEDTINFFGDPGAVTEQTVRPYVEMKAQLHHYDAGEEFGIGEPVLDNGNPVIGLGTAPIDIPNCERCHSLGDGVSVNSAQNDRPGVAALVQAEYDFWWAQQGSTGSDWYPRLKAAAISILAIHDEQHGTSFTAAYDPLSGDANASTRLGHETVICQRCHADNVIAVVKSADCGPGQDCDVNDPRNQLFSQIKPGSMLIPPLTEAIHMNHRDNPFSDSEGRSGGCQGCHPAHRSDGVMDEYPITEDGLNAFADTDNRNAAGGCYVGRDVHSNPKRNEHVGTPEHLNAVGAWLQANVSRDPSPDGPDGKGIWCTNCHSQLGQELWKAENMEDLVHGVGLTNVREPASLTGDVEADLDVVLGGLGISPEQGRAWLDPNNDTAAAVGTTPDVQMAAIWEPDPGMCAHAAALVGLAPADPFQDGNVATIEINLVFDEDGNPSGDPANCSTGVGLPGPDCFGTGEPTFYICGSLDADGDVNVALTNGPENSPFCTTPDCVAAAQATLNSAVGQTAVPVPFSAATDGRDHWLASGNAHCADCHAAPYVEQSGNINAFPPFNYPRKASLFRYTRGHQDITCQGCHESIHGLYPTTAVDTTSQAQAAGMNTDGSLGPLKCGACHDANDQGVNKTVANLTYEGNPIGLDFDAAVSWMHTYTDEADVRDYICQRCHEDNSALIAAGNNKWNSHAWQGRVSRASMDKAEILQNGNVNGDPDVEDPYTTLCTSCHGNRSSVLARKGCNDRWKNHLVEGRASEKVWEYVSNDTLGDTCGY